MVRRNVTLARQAAQEIIEGIQSGALAGDDGLLPSEAALSRRLGVSRATLREALSQLEHGGLIVRRHGIGTFLASRQPLVESGLEELESIETLARRTGVEIHMGDCDVHERPASGEEAAALGVPAASLVLVVERVMMSQERPIAFLVDVLPTEFLTLQDLGTSFRGSVLDFILERGTPALQHSYTEINAEAASSDLAKRLQLRTGAPLLRFVAQLYETHGRVVDYSISYFRPGQFRFHVVRRVRQFPMSAFEGSAPDAALVHAR
jgi:GntR family transcriptional regulator